MKNAIKEAFNVLIEKRVEGAAFLEVKQTPRYAETEKQIDEVFGKLRTSFGAGEQGTLLLELEDAWYRQQSLFLEYAYRQGLKDSVVLQDLLKKYEVVKTEA